MREHEWWRKLGWGMAALVLLAAALAVLLWQVPRLLNPDGRTRRAVQGRSTAAVTVDELSRAPVPLSTQALVSQSRPTVSEAGPSTTPSQTAAVRDVPTPSPVAGGISTMSTPSSTPALSIALDPDLPSSVVETVYRWAVQRQAVTIQDGPADIALGLTSSAGAKLVSERFFVPVQRFWTLREAITLGELRQAWAGDAGRLLVAEDVAFSLAAMWGDAQGAVEVVPSGQMVEALWQDGGAVGIVSFDALEPRLTPLDLDGRSAVDNRLDQQTWPLALRIWLRGSRQEAEDLLVYLQEDLAPTSRDPEKLTVLVMTGVTAMSRMTAVTMERHGDYAYPAHVIGSEVAAADITHISNEVPLVPGCNPDPTLNNIVLCSKPEYLASLEEVGADIVGLTGNHQNDFGQEAMLTSLEIYAQHGLKVYAGGANDEEARRPLTITHSGNRLAFLGANAIGPINAWATSDAPGSARFDLETMRQDIAAVRPLADVVSVEVQHIEFDPSGEYQAEPEPQQRADFEALSAAGADIVTGVQAHRPQAIEFTPNGMILFGLGNLFFDQMNWWETRQGLIARHVIYDGRHISTELLVTVLEDWSQPRWATPDERSQILAGIFTASGW